MFEAQVGEKAFTIVAKWWMADIMPHGNGLDEIFIKAQKTTNRSGDAGNQLNVKNPVGDMIVGNKRKYLCFINISAVGSGVKNPVCIKGKLLPICRGVFGGSS